MLKFGKNREVDKYYLNVPVKYILHYDGANCDRKAQYTPETYEEWRASMEDFIKRNPIFKNTSLSKETYEMLKANGHVQNVLRKESRDKTLCIVQFYGNHLALVAWRNNNTFKMGMTRICLVVEKNDKFYIKYRGKLILISDPSGWVF